MFKVKKHSGLSVFKWRVYRILPSGGQVQLGKHRTREAAEKELAFRQEREKK